MTEQECKVLTDYPILSKLSTTEIVEENIGNPFLGDDKEPEASNEMIEPMGDNYSQAEGSQTMETKSSRTWNRVDEKTRLQYPYRINGVLVSIFMGDDGKQHFSKGSATLIGPQQIITAAHNIYSFVKENNVWVRKGWAYACKFYPAVSAVQGQPLAPSAPYGIFYGTKFFKNPAYQGITLEQNSSNYNAWKADMENDYAMIILNQDIGTRLGWAGINDPDNNMLLNSKQNIAAYPYDNNDPSNPPPSAIKNTLWEMYRDFNASVLSVQANTYKTNMDVWVGMSGGGLWFNYPNGISLNGIQSFRDNGVFANRITTAKKNDLNNWLKEKP
jgi:V8-like Glu-specific endopeptidase